MEQHNYTVTTPLKSVLIEEIFITSQLQLLSLEDNFIESSLQNMTREEYEIVSQLQQLAIEDFAIVPDNLQLASFYFAERFIYSDLAGFENHKYKINCKLANLSEDYKEITTSLVERPWTIILAVNHNLAQASNNKHVEELLNPQEFNTALEKLKKQFDEDEINWQEYGVGVINTWLDKVAANKIDEWNGKFQDGVNAVQKFNNALQNYTGISAGGVTSKIASGISGAMREISSAFRSSNSELATKLSGSGASLLKGSILDQDWLTLVNKNPGLESVSLLGMTYIKAKKSSTGQLSWGPTMLPMKFTAGFSDIAKDVRSRLRGSIFDQDYVKKAESSTYMAGDTLPHNMHYVKAETTTGPTYLPSKTEDYPVKMESATKDVPEISETNKYLAKIKSTTVSVPDPSKAHYVGEDNPSITLHRMLTSPDAQLQRFVAYFTTKDKNGEEHLLKMLSPDEQSDYFYYFYSNGFSCNPVKKTTTELSYGAFKTTIALEKPDVNNTFNFSLPTDLQATFWKFVLEKGLGVNIKDNVYSSENFIEGYQSINLNFALLQSTTDSTKLNADTARVNKFVLENIYFSNIDALKFQQDFGASPVKTSIKGIYKRLTWYHNALLLDR